jgi:4a-hydroxytetrahydrobiopterin dehydratase
MSELAAKTCVPCRGGVPALKGGELEALLRLLDEGWKVINEHHLEKNYAFPDFKQALAFANRVGAVAEEQGHHPDIYVAWGKVILTIWTHAIDGLTESDFILAAKADQVLGPAGRATHGVAGDRRHA